MFLGSFLKINRIFFRQKKKKKNDDDENVMIINLFDLINKKTANSGVA